MMRFGARACSLSAAVVTAVVVLAGCSVAVAEVVSETKPLNKHDKIKYKDCGHLFKTGYNVSGVHELWMNKTTSFLIVCEFKDGNAFNVIQRRMDATTSFAMPLATYIAGFGNAQSNYWAGLNHISYLTSAQGNNVLTVHLTDWSGRIVSLTYPSFLVRPEENRYQMIVSGYRGPAGLDDLTYHNGATFQTYDYPDPHGCATHMLAGWWYNYCAYALLNGKYYYGGKYTPTSFYDGIFWRDWTGYDYSLKFVSMVVSTT